MDAKDNFTWVIAHIDNENLAYVKNDINKKRQYAGVQYFVPMIKILKKKFKGKPVFDEIPLLFNYGFFHLPRTLAVHIEFLDQMKKDIGCIYSWVQDPAKRIIPHQYTEQNHYRDCHIPIATTSKEMIAHFVELEKNAKIYTTKDIENLTEGTRITLQGYPYDNLDAEIISVNARKGEAKVLLLLEGLTKPATVSLDNIFYTIYKNYHEQGSAFDKSLDEMASRKTNILDRVLFSKSY